MAPGWRLAAPHSSAISYWKTLTPDSIEVARLWVSAYDELVRFDQKVLDRLHKLLPTLVTESRHEAELTDLPMIVQHLQTFRYRRAHWRQRLQELDGN